jgi:hypothetical protein
MRDLLIDWEDRADYAPLLRNPRWFGISASSSIAAANVRLNCAPPIGSSPVCVPFSCAGYVFSIPPSSRSFYTARYFRTSAGCPRNVQQIALAFGVDIDKDVVRHVLMVHYRPESDSEGPSGLTFIGYI